MSENPWYAAMQRPKTVGQWAKDIGDLTRLNRDYLPADYRSEAPRATIEKVVHVSGVSTPGTHVEETDWVTGLAEAGGVPDAIIGAVTPGLAPAELSAELDRQRRSARFKGIRIRHGFDPASDFADLLFGQLHDHGLIFELVARSGELAAHVPLVERFPELPVVLEHAGWPAGTDAGDLGVWREALAALAALPNVTCKFSGVPMVTHSLAAADLRPYFDVCLDLFGADRCMFGSNFPVDSLFGDLQTLLDSMEEVTEALDESGREALFVTNAERVYGI
jgi:predicted TIM-barrel fold metal-dependent hydrolase